MIYLGNRSIRYSAKEERLLVASPDPLGVIKLRSALTFKASGADVSASVIFCEKRSELRPISYGMYDMCVERIDRVAG